MHTSTDNTSIKVNLVRELADNNDPVANTADNFAMEELERAFAQLAAADAQNEELSAKLLSPSERAVQS
jgi:hypothetical protein